MSLPQAFADASDYFKESIKFFKEYQSLIMFPNTDILVNNILDTINTDKLEDENIFDKNFDLTKTDNCFLKDFFEKLEKLKGVYDEFIEDQEIESKRDVPLSPKKLHEIVYLAKEIAVMCEETECDVVVDLGSGLGYLDQMLFEITNLKILGLECNESHYVGAKKRQRKYHINSVDHVKYIKHFVSENSHSNIENYLQDKFVQYNGFCITGLHACADLTIDAINLFLKMADAKSMIIMPCCYHKLRKGCTEESRFENFPLSNCLKGEFEKYNAYSFMNVPFLRLASQPPYRTEDNLEDTIFNLLARAVLQLYADRCNCQLKRNKRKAVRLKTTQNEFSNYIQNAANGFTLIQKPANDSCDNGSTNKELTKFDIEELQSIWREISSLKLRAAIFVLLQNYLQPIIENFVLFDRLVYLRENGVNGRFKRIFNKRISPRSLALLSYK